MPQNKPKTAFTVKNMLGTVAPAPLPKNTAPKKTGGLKKTLKTLKLAGIGVLGVAGGIWGANKIMDLNAPAITQTAQAKTPAFNPLTLQQQISNIVTQMKAYNAAHPDDAYSPKDIEQAQRDFVNNIERNEMLKRANKPLSDALDTYILKALKTNLQNNDVATAIKKTNLQTINMVNQGHQTHRTNLNSVLIPELGEYVNMQNAKKDHAGTTVSELAMLSGAVKSRIAAANAFLTGYTNTQALQMTDTFRAVSLTPDLKFAVEKSDYERKAASDRAVKNVSDKTHENIKAGQEPFTALCNAAQNVTGLDRNEFATPPAYIAKAYGAANQELTGKSSWVASISAAEKPTPSLPWNWWYVGAGLAAIGAVSGTVLWTTRDKGRGFAKDLENNRKIDKKNAAKDEITTAMALNIPKGLRQKSH